MRFVWVAWLAACTPEVPGDTDEPAGCTPSRWYADVDGDGFGDAGHPSEACEIPASHVENDEDCDDFDPFVAPGAAEACDGADNDCSGAADEPWDRDGDGAAPCAGDCDDDDPTNAPGFPEVCDGRDNNCDGQIDEGADDDEDGWADCHGDCDDDDPDTNPGAPELCDGKDNDCDPETIEDADDDGDGIVICEGDCDDLDAQVYTGHAETCDGLDNDCDGLADDDPSCWGCVTDGPYVACPQYDTFEGAEERCVLLGGTLASPADDAENLRISNLAASVSYYYYYDAFWFGLDDREDEGTWRTPSGAPAVWQGGWYPGEPNDSGGDEDCAGLNFAGLGTWNDYSCSSSLLFVCET